MTLSVERGGAEERAREGDVELTLSITVVRVRFSLLPVARDERFNTCCIDPT